MRKTDKITNGTKATFYAEWLKQQLRMIEELIKLLISIRWKSHEVLLVSKVECGRDVNTKETFNFIRRQLQTVFNGYKRFSKKSSKKDAAKRTLSAHKRIIREKDAKKIQLYIIFY